MSNTANYLVVSNMTLITGGARSGKSSFAEKLALERGGEVFYIATMEERKDDVESQERINRHRHRRPETWSTIETPLAVSEQVDALAEGKNVCLIDCLSLFVSNLLLRDYDEKKGLTEIEVAVTSACSELLAAIQRKPDTNFIIVTNEVGWGIVPENGLARMYRDLLGLTNQQFAQAAGSVWLCCVGLQVKLK